MRDLSTYRAERRNAMRDSPTVVHHWANVWRKGPFHVSTTGVRKPRIGAMFKTWTSAHASYGRTS